MRVTLGLVLSVSAASAVGTRQARQEQTGLNGPGVIDICSSCGPTSPLREARVSTLVHVPSGESFDFSLAAANGSDVVGLRLTAGRAVLFSNVGGHETLLGTGSRNTSRTISLDGWKRVELDWRGNNIFYRVYGSQAARPGAPLGGFTMDRLDVLPRKLHIAATGGTTIDGTAITHVVAGYPAGPGELPTTASQGIYFPANKKVVPVPTWLSLSPSLPAPILDSDPDLVRLYNNTWQILLSKNILQPRPSSPLVRTYVDSGFDPTIMFQWDTLFSLQYAIYAHGGFDAIASLDNWYVVQGPTGEIRRAYNSRTGAIHPWAAGPNGVNPPLFAWAELTAFRQTADIDRVKRVLPALRAYADWVSVQMWSQASPHQLYWNNGNGNGMDNLPTQLGQGGDGGTNGVANVDMSSQMVLMRNSLAELEGAAGEGDRAADHRAWADAIAEKIRRLAWNEEDGRFYELTASGAQWKVDSLAGFWSLLAGVASPAQASRLRAALTDASRYWTDMVFPTLSQTDSRFDPKGDYWRGGVWAPTTFATIKGVQQTGDRALARAASERYLAGIRDAFDYSGTLFELYAPFKQSSAYISASYTGEKTGLLRPIVLPNVTLSGTHVAPGTDEKGSALNSRGGSDNLAKDQFVGWTGLAPITLLLENVIGIEADSPRGLITWGLQRTDRHGIANLNLGRTGTLTLIADARASPSSHTHICITGKVSKSLTVEVTVGSNKVKTTLAAGAINDCSSTATWQRG